MLVFVFFVCLVFRSFVGVCFTAVLFILGWGNSAGLPLTWTLGVCLLSLGLCAAQAWGRDSKYWTVPVGVFAVLLVSGGYLAIACRPFSFRMACTVCPTNLKNVAAALDSYRDENGKLPESLYLLSPKHLSVVPHCLPQGANDLGKQLYGLQGLTFGPYNYEITKEGYLLSCPSGAHAATPAGYPRFGELDGLVQLPPR